MRWLPFFFQVAPQNGTEFASNQGEHLANPDGKWHARVTPLPTRAWWKSVKTSTPIPISDPCLFGAGWPWGAGGEETTKTTKHPNAGYLTRPMGRCPGELIVVVVVVDC